MNLFKHTLENFKTIAHPKALTTVPLVPIREDYDYQTVSQIEPAKPSLVTGALIPTSNERLQHSPFKSTSTSNINSVTKTQNQTETSAYEHLYLPVSRPNAQCSPTYKRHAVNAEMIIHSFRPHLAELLNIISYTQHKALNHESITNHDLLFSVLYKVSQALELQITAVRMRQIIVDNQNQGMFYAVRSKPESLLYYPVFKMIMQEGWAFSNQTETFKDLILKQISKL